ncbi:DMT family transporter [Patescibacteria group bacterium]|nr:DMT family transporter [Patescibacteria group bacterium]MCL5797862.1 DMT family transporter [Patescibacteria group bacterium]
MAIFFALITLLGWGTGDVFITISSRKIGHIYSVFWGFIISLFFVSLYIPFAGPIASYPIFFLAILLNLIQLVGALTYFKSLEIGNASLSGAIAGSFPLLSVIFALTVFKEIITSVQLGGIICILVGIILSSVNFGELKKYQMKSLFSNRSVNYALLTLVFWGIYFAFARITVQGIGWFWAVYPVYVLPLFFLFSPAIRKNAVEKLKKGKAFGALLAYALLILTGNFTYNAGLLHGFTSVVAPIAGSSPIVFVALARIIFKEKLNSQQKAGILFSLAGIIFISFSH